MSHILKLEAENFKRLSVVSITPDGVMVTLTGKNGAGKSSVLDAIWAVLDPKASMPDKPLREGETEGRIVLHLGDDKPDLIATRSFTEKGNYLKVTDADGKAYGSPQKVLDALIGTYAVDPIEFMRLGSTVPGRKKQAELLRTMVKFDADIPALDKERANLFERRTAHNSASKRARARADAIKLPEDMPDEMPDTTELTRQLAAAGEINAVAWVKKNEHTRLVDQLGKDEAALEEILARVQILKDAIGMARARIEAYQVPEEANAGELQANLLAAQHLQRAFDQQAQQIEAMTEEEVEDGKAAACTLRIEAIDSEKTTALANAKMPVEGLGFGEDTVLFKGLPLSQASYAEQVRVSAAIAIAENPTLKIMCIRDGSTLDSDSLKLLAGLAEANDTQIWIERVDESGEVGFVMEDGHVRGQEKLVAEAKEEKKPAKPASKKAAAEKPADDAATVERKKRAMDLLHTKLTELASDQICKDVQAAAGLNAVVKAKLANFPDLIREHWTTPYLERVKALSK